MRGFGRLAAALAALVLVAPAHAAGAGAGRSAFEDGLAEAINGYRAELGLPAVARSIQLDLVARAHADDLAAYAPDLEVDRAGRRCNLHSWSGHGGFAPLCYTADHAAATAMWGKPAEVTRGRYPGRGFEIALIAAEETLTISEALRIWRASRDHEAVIAQRGPWRDTPWRAMGIARARGYVVLWFGMEPDSAAAPVIAAAR